MVRKHRLMIMTLLAAVLTAFPASAATLNPMTGDTMGRYMWIVIAALGVSLAVIIIIAITSGKKKK